MTAPDYDLIAREALAAADHLVTRWLPEGYCEGQWWVAINPRRNDHSAGSFKISMRDGGWKDYAGGDGDKGGDLIALYAYLNDLSQSDAARAVADELRLPRDETPAVREVRRGGTKSRSRDEWLKDWEILRPVPDGGPPWAPMLDHKAWGTATHHWLMLDARGRLIALEVRWWNAKDGKKECRYLVCARHRRTGTMRWFLRWPEQPWPIHGLADLARRPEAPVMVVEGPKARDAMAALLPAFVVCSPSGGSDNAAKCDWQPLTGRDVTALPDADAAGSKVVAALRKVVDPLVELDPAKVFALLDPKGPPEVPRGWDVADLPDELIRPNDEFAAALRLRSLEAPDPYQEAAPPQNPPPGDGGGGQGGDDGGDDGSGDTGGGRGLYGKRYRKLKGALEGYLGGIGLVVDGLGAWRRERDWQLQDVTVDTITNLFLDQYREKAPANASNVGEIINAIVAKRESARRDELIGKLTGKPRSAAGDDALRAWVRAVVGNEDELWVESMRHWLWLVKRRLTWRRTEFDIMPVVYGLAQGSGKTTAVEKLCGPLAELVIADLDVTYFQDERKVPVLARAAIGVWDEMSGSGRADIQKLKHAITANEIAYRPMKTTKHAPLRRMCTFIGTSNPPVRDIIVDTTGARRFVELPALERCDWDVINTLDYDLLWQAVSEDDDAPAGDIMPQLKLHQGELVHKDQISMWLESETWDAVDIRLADANRTLHIPAHDAELGEHRDHLFARFQHWCRLVGQNPLGTKTVFARLREEGFTQHQPTIGGSRERRWLLPPDREWSRVSPFTFAADDDAGSETSTAQANPPSQGGDDDPPW